jgi:uncharacterized protein with ParB-like and HNH nuclease domain
MEAEILKIKDMVEKANQFDLPDVQRGFVWKTSQIENLWDSLLRSFLVGAIIVDSTKSDGIYLLDGQQRITSILLGF